MHLFLQFNGRFTPKADRLARLLAAHHGFTRFSGISTSEGHASWLGRERNTPIRYHHVQALPELWRRALERGRPDPERLRRIEEDHGNLWRFVIADRNLGHTFLTGTIVPETHMRGRAAELEVVLSCIQELFDYFEARFAADRPDAVFFQVVASAPALVCAAVCRRLGIPFFTLGKTKLDDRHHLATNALMQPDQVDEAYADPALAVGGAAHDRVREAQASVPRASDHYEADQRNFRARHGGSWAGFLAERLRALPAALRRWDKPYAPDPRAATPWQLWRWETRVKLNYRALVRDGYFDARPPAGDFLYFALSVTPEASTCIVAPQYADQLIVISALARSLPAGWRLVVKDHLPMCGRRTRAFYDQVRQYQNTVLVDPTLRSTELIRDARLTAVIAGTSGWEAMVMGKPVLAFADAWFLATGLGWRCTDLNDVHGDIGRALALCERVPAGERQRRLERMTQAMLDGSFPLGWAAMWAPARGEALDALEPALAGIAGRLAARLARMRAEGVVPDPFDTSAWTRDRTPPAEALA